MSEAKVQWLVVTDLDGTMLNHHSYDLDAARETVRTLKDKGIPVILNTSKTFSETTSIRRILNIQDAFIVENGSCIYLPKADFDRPQSAGERDDYWSVVLGASHQSIENVLALLELPEEDAVRLSQCSVQQAIELTGLSSERAEQAIAREFSEPIIWLSDDVSLAAFQQQLGLHGMMTLQGGRFLHVIGDSDKGRATTALMACYKDKVKSIVLGDSANDAAMLTIADISVIVNSPSNHQLQKLVCADIQTQLPAPEGWREAIEKSLQQINLNEG